MASSIYRSSDEFTSLCNPCLSIKKKNVDASYFCEECKEFLCSECRTHHRMVTLTRDHTLTPQLESRIKQISMSPAKGIYSKATLTSQFSMSENDDKPCQIRGIVCFDDLMFLADYANNNIKVFDDKLCFVSKTTVKQPNHITAVGNDQLVTISDPNNIVVFFRVGYSLELARSFKSPSSVYALCHHGGDLYASCKTRDAASSQILVFNINGELKRRLEPISNGKLILQHIPHGIAYNSKYDNIVVTDWTNGVVAVTATEKLVFCKLPTRVEKAESVDIDEFGQIYVCGLKSNNIVKTSHDGQQSMDILTKESGCYKPVVLKIYGNKLILGCVDSAIIRIYTLS